MCSYIIDRFEGNLAVLEDNNKNHIIIDKSLLPKNSKAYDVITFDGTRYYIDNDTTNKRKKTIQDLENELFN